MIVIDKKKILMLTVGLFCFSSLVFVNINRVGETIQTSATPVSNRIIVLDAGHGKPDEGATGYNGSTEEKITLEITLKIQKLLEESGATVILTRSDENGIYNQDAQTIREKKVSDIKNRVDISNNSSADILVSIHLNKGNSNTYSGWQTFYSKKSEKGKKLANCIQSELKDIIKVENKRQAHDISGIYLIDNVQIPATIVECGFLSNPQEEHKMGTGEYQNLLAWGIYNGILNYFNN